MGDLTAYEKELAQQLYNLPLPSEDLAWEEMNELLDKDNDKGGIIPTPDRNNVLWALLILLFLMGAFWLVIHPKKPVGTDNKNYKNETVVAENNFAKIKSNETEKNKIASPELNAKEKGNNNIQLQNETKTSGDDLKGSTKTIAKRAVLKNKKVVNFPKNNATIYVVELPLNGTPDNYRPFKNDKKNLQGNKGLAITKKGKTKFTSVNAIAEDGSSDGLKESQEPQSIDSNKNTEPQQNQTTASIPGIVLKKDNNAAKPIASIIKADSIVTIKKDAKKTKKLYLAVGIALQQSIRLNCDCVYAYDDYTHTTKFTDYLPSVYFRLYHAKKWFLQTEFKYATPQLIDEFIYKAKIQNLPLNYITTSYTLKKVYYNQADLSFNYFVLPNWAVGVGVMYNNFSGAVIQQDFRKKLYSEANDSLISSKILNENDDTGFVNLLKNNVQASFETQYNWKRFSLGARYAFGLQPYVEYTDPYLHTPVQKKNNSMNIFIRYEFWRSKK